MTQPLALPQARKSRSLVVLKSDSEPPLAPSDSDALPGWIKILILSSNYDPVPDPPPSPSKYG